MDKQIIHLINQAILENPLESGVAQLVNNKQEGAGNFFAKTSGVVSGVDVVKQIFEVVNPNLKVNIIKNNGEYVNRGDVIISVKGKLIDILKCQKLVVNFLQLLSGVSTIVNKFAEELDGLNCKILANQKGLPIINSLYYQAFENGGGISPSNYVRIDEYQIMLAGTISNAVELIRKKYRYDDLEIIVSSKDEFDEAVELNIKRIILNSTDDSLIDECLFSKTNDIEFCVSGNFSLGRIRSLGKKSIDYIIVDNISSLNKGLEVGFKLYKRSLI